MEFTSTDLTGQIIGAAIAVHRELGPGFLEIIYHRALIIELQKRGLTVAKEVDIHVMYDGQCVGLHRLDLLVENAVIVELKAARGLEDIFFATVRSYLKAADIEDGLLLNFAKPTLEIRRIFKNG